MAVPPILNGWIVVGLPEFARRYLQLRERARRLKVELSPEEYRAHPDVKIAADVYRLLSDIVPRDPDAPEFRLKRDLSNFRRAKGHGLPPRFRLFWVFSTQHKTIIFLYINDASTLRKEGARTDPYQVFRQLIAQGRIGKDFRANLDLWKAAYQVGSSQRRDVDLGL